MVGLFLELGEQALLVGDQVPFVEADHDGPALALGQVDKRQVLLLERDGRVEQHHDHFCKADSAQRISNRELLQLLLDARTLAHAGGVEQLDLVAAPFPVDGYGVARDAGFGTHKQAILADHAVDQRRLARIRAADDGDAQGPVRVEIILGIIARGIVPGRLLVSVLVFGLIRDEGRERLQQVGRALAMLRRERDGIAEAERIGVDDAVRALLALGLVGQQDHRLAGPADEIGEGLVHRGEAEPGVDHEHHDIGLGDGRLGLGAHAAGERILVRLFQPGGVDHLEAQMTQRRVALAAVARDAWPVVDQGQLLADQPVEQRRLADIGPADEGDDGCHFSQSMRRPRKRRPESASDQFCTVTGPPRTSAR